MCMLYRTRSSNCFEISIRAGTWYEYNFLTFSTRLLIPTSGPLTLKKGSPHSVATALARSVFPLVRGEAETATATAAAAAAAAPKSLTSNVHALGADGFVLASRLEDACGVHTTSTGIIFPGSSRRTHKPSETTSNRRHRTVSSVNVPVKHTNSRQKRPPIKPNPP